MKVAEAKRVARAWVLDHAASVPGLWAVMFGGSINWLPDGAEVGPYSDVDLWHLIRGDVDTGLQQHRISHNGLFLEPAYLPREDLASEEKALNDWGMAIHLTKPSIIYDPTGELGRIQQVVSRSYAEPCWVRRRCQSIAESLRSWLLPSLRGDTSKDDPLAAYGFSVLNIAQIPVVASVKPLTIRKAGAVFTDMMRMLHQERVAERFLDLIGSLRMTRSDLEGLLGACIPAYDRAVAVHRTPLFLGHYLDPPARQGMIGGTRDLIDRGYHREAAWWIFVSHFAARRALGLDAPEEYERVYRGPFEALLQALGIDTPNARERKAALAEDLLSSVMALAESIIGGTA